jgi:hypothetical protein
MGIFFVGTIQKFVGEMKFIIILPPKKLNNPLRVVSVQSLNNDEVSYSFNWAELSGIE